MPVHLEVDQFASSHVTKLPKRGYELGVAAGDAVAHRVASFVLRTLPKDPVMDILDVAGQFHRVAAQVLRIVPHIAMSGGPA